MLTKIGKDRTMSSTSDATMEARPFLADMVEREKRRTGSKMRAYEIVASLSGRSSSWVRKALAGNGGVGLCHDVFLNIAASYIRLCECVEDARDQEGRAIASLLERANAAVEGNSRLAEAAKRAARARADNAKDGAVNKDAPR